MNPKKISTISMISTDAARAQYYAQKRLDFEKQWADLASLVTAVFLERQYATQNWTTSMSYLDDQPDCNCNNQGTRLVASAVINSPSASAVPMSSASSMRDTSQAPLPNHTQPFLDDRSASPLYGQLRNGKISERELRKPLTQSIDLHQRIMYHKELLYVKGLNFSSLELYAQKCARCFGPREGETKISPDEPNVIICADGNFQHRHYAYASKDNPAEHDYHSSFLLPSQITKVAELCKNTASLASDIKTACSDSHTAANDTRSSASWRKSCDDNGLFAFACRHELMLKMANLHEESEKLHYPVSILGHFLEQLPDIKFGVLYDIGCHLDAHIKKRGLLPNHQSRLMFGTAVFHAYVHEWACQIIYNPRYNDYWGLSDGEGLERLWSFLSALVAVLRTSTRLHRFWAIHWRCNFYNDNLKSTSGHWLLSKYQNALRVKDQASQGLSELYTQRNPHDPGREFYSAEFFKEQWTLERNAQASKKQAEEKQRLELERLLSLEEEIQQLWNSPVPTAEFELSRARRLNDLQEKITTQRKKVGADDVLALLSTIFKEKLPLNRSRAHGRNSNLGVDGRTAILATIRKHAVALSKAVDCYQDRLNAFRRQFPNRLVYPPEIEYATLFKIQPDDPFWSEGLFTNHSEPWAIDPSTQYGMRQMSYLERSEEELRRVGWEVRREMRWIISTRYRLSHLLQNLLQGLWEPNLLNIEALQPLLNHSNLSRIDPQSRHIAVLNLLHTRLIQLLHHLEMTIFRGDGKTCAVEQQAEAPVEEGMNDEGRNEEGRNNEYSNVGENPNLVIIEEEDEDEDADEEEEIVKQTVLSATEKAVALALDRLALYDDMEEVVD
ncbi:hypothetical protein DFH28DRAFT_1121694 [Melampsora americana]|nr:hypothetical protein DFH28DRAFT_1121694 [Melampsora americana]